MSEKSSDLEAKFARLRKCLAKRDANGVQDAILDLSPMQSGWRTVPDELVERLLSLLESEHMYESPLAGHVLNYFEFESGRLSARQKSLCMAFLDAHGDQFVDVHSRQVVTELRYQTYLK